ncbi:hypothetical protein KCP73_16915 [Salmonella enterica subsp. enterica]|nr:hypothetical protein KCP73_16915 [Salmonella enterica subsp. enterica]
MPINNIPTLEDPIGAQRMRKRCSKQCETPHWCRFLPPGLRAALREISPDVILRRESCVTVRPFARFTAAERGTGTGNPAYCAVRRRR